VKDVNLFNTIIEGIYSLILVGYYESNEFWKAVISLFVSFIFLVQNLFIVILMNLRRRI
jgi:amino acid transporter